MKAKDVKKKLNITQMTLSRYVKLGKIKVAKINPYHYEYSEEDVNKMLGLDNCNRINISYSRVSNHKQKEDLDRQKQRIYDYCSSQGIKLNLEYSEIKSGMNFEREKLLEILNKINNNEVSKLIIENKDRIARFGFELIEVICKLNNCELIVIQEEINNKSYEQEMTEDLISIIHHFSMKMYSNRRKLNKMLKELKQEDADT